MFTQIFLVYLFLNNAKTDTLFKYISTKDTVYVYSDDVLKTQVYQENCVYRLSEDAISRMNNIVDKAGTMFLWLENCKKYIILKQIDWWIDYLPDGYHILMFDGSFVHNEGYINIGYIGCPPPWRLKCRNINNSKKHGRKRTVTNDLL